MFTMQETITDVDIAETAPSWFHVFSKDNWKQAANCAEHEYEG